MPEFRRAAGGASIDRFNEGWWAQKDAAGNDYRAPILKINELLGKALAGRPNTEFLDIWEKFLAPYGTLPTSMMDDGTHPTEAGYAVWARALVEAGVRK
jgi:lysophospholipase L1-like esterase